MQPSKRLRFEGDQMVIDGMEDGLSTGPDAELVEGSVEVALDGPQAETERPGNLLVRHSVSGQPEHLELASAEVGATRPLGARPPSGQRGGYTRLEHGGPRGHRANGLEQLGAWCGLEEITGNARLERLQNVVLLVVGGEHQDPSHWREPSNLAGGLDPGEAGQPEVEQDEIGPQPRNNLDGVVAPTRL